MNRILLVIKFLLLMVLLCLNINYVRIFGINDFLFFIYLILFGVLLFFNVRDLIKKICVNTMYEVLNIFVNFVVLFPFIRVTLRGGILPILYNYKDYYLTINSMYMGQNSIYFILLLSLLIIYRYINVTRRISLYHPISVWCFIFSVASVIPTLQCFSGTGVHLFYYLIFNIILVMMEIYRLIKDNHVKREWLIYFSFLFNMFAFISIFVNF